jgi:hypothetical protein
VDGAVRADQCLLQLNSIATRNAPERTHPRSTGQEWKPTTCQVVASSLGSFMPVLDMVICVLSLELAQTVFGSSAFRW